LIIHGDPFLSPQIVRAPAGVDLPTTLAGLSVTYSQSRGQPAPILEVHPFWTCPEEVVLFRVDCGSLAAITFQIPFEAQSEFPVPVTPAPGIPLAFIFVTQNGAPAENDITVVADQVHLITNCDTFVTNSTFAGSNATGLQCPQIVAHGDGSLVSATNPAQPGEEVVAYAVGLGQTNPASVTGQVVIKSAPTVTTFTLDYNFHPNALASRPLANGPRPVYAGTTPGYVGLYQVNFTVPPMPAGTPPCVDTSKLFPPYNVVQSNLTVSIGGQYSFDGARICVATQ
jgi:uncharacterized protein (TIGR03437 family)